MKFVRQGHILCMVKSAKREYPCLSILLAAGLLLLSPFTDQWLSAVAMVICFYRVIRYDARVFATDYCILLPLTYLTFVHGSPALLIYLCLLASIWYFVIGGMKADNAFVILLALLNYLLARMQMDINNFVLCFGQLFVLCVLLPKQDGESAVQAAKAFCTSLVLSSAYAFVLQDTWQIQRITGTVDYAIWGTNIIRFNGLFPDPNYFMTLLIIGLGLLVKMKEFGHIKTSRFLIQGVIMTVFGILSYSKTFFLVFIVLGGMYVLWQFWSRKILSGMAISILAIAALLFMVFSEYSPFAVVIQRFLEADNISDVTTGRTRIYLAYWNEITSSPLVFFFGKGLAAEGLWRDPHNIYLEAMYYIGTVGFGLIAALYIALVSGLRRRVSQIREQHLIARTAVPAVFFLLYASLHGIFQIVAYGGLFLSMLSFLITKKEPDPVPPAIDGGGVER